MESVEAAYLRNEQAVASFCPNLQRSLQREEERPKLISDETQFNPIEHLIFSPPGNTWTLTDMELEYSSAITSFASSGDFPLFSVEAISKMRGELLSDAVQQKFQESNSIVSCQLRGMVPEYARFTYNAWNHPKTLAAISKVVGLDLVPVMNIEIAHVNILPSSNTLDHHPVKWHRDDYPYACVLMLSDTTHMIGGGASLRTGSGAILFADPLKMGFAYILHGRCIQHAVRAFEGCAERITAVTSFRPRSPFIEDQTQLSNVRGISDLAQLYFQFVQYRWRIAIQRLRALKHILDGEEVYGWIMKSSSLGDNLKDIQHFLRDTSTQIGLPTLEGMVAVSSEVNGIDLITGCPKRVVCLFSVGLRLAADSLMSRLQEQENMGSFDRELAQSTFGFVDNILLQLMEE